MKMTFIRVYYANLSRLRLHSRVVFDRMVPSTLRLYVHIRENMLSPVREGPWTLVIGQPRASIVPIQDVHAVDTGSCSFIPLVGADDESGCLLLLDLFQ